MIIFLRLMNYPVVGTANLRPNTISSPPSEGHQPTAIKPTVWAQ